MKKSIIAAIGVAAAITIAMVVVGMQQFGSSIPQRDFPGQDTIIQEQQISKIKVIASFYPYFEFSKNIAGDKADVAAFIPTGIEPHDWEPSTGNLISLKEANVFVYNGAGIEPYVEKLIDSGEYSNVHFVDASGGIEMIKSEDEHEDEHEDEPEFLYDPHIWLDPILVKQQVMTIKDALIQADPNNAKYYENNAMTYSAKLDALDSKIRTELSKCNKDTIVPFHNAFTYFGARYGIKIHAISGIAPESEVTASELKELIDFVKKNEIKVIFAEELVDPTLANVLAEEAGARVLLLSPIEGITQEEQARGVSYLSKMEENLNNIKVALECQ